MENKTKETVCRRDVWLKRERESYRESNHNHYLLFSIGCRFLPLQYRYQSTHLNILNNLEWVSLSICLYVYECSAITNTNLNHNNKRIWWSYSNITIIQKSLIKMPMLMPISLLLLLLLHNPLNTHISPSHLKFVVVFSFFGFVNWFWSRTKRQYFSFSLSILFGISSQCLKYV